MIVNPCYGCIERHEACWGHCEEYKAWKSEYDAVADKKKKENLAKTIRLRIPKRWRKKGQV